jgi:hypothetical protein
MRYNNARTAFIIDTKEKDKIDPLSSVMIDDAGFQTTAALDDSVRSQGVASKWV